MSSNRPSKIRKNETLINDLLALIACKNLSYGTKRAAVDNILWHWTERDGKYHGSTKKSGCQFWSKGALDVLATEVGLLPRKIGSKLTHEHVVPRAYIADLILCPNASWREESLKQLLETCCRAVIVEKEEEDKKLSSAKMPEGWQWEKDNPWARYLEAEVKVFEAEVKHVGRKWQISPEPRPVSVTDAF